jgi:hypothetical protein
VFAEGYGCALLGCGDLEWLVGLRDGGYLGVDVGKSLLVKVHQVTGLTVKDNAVSLCDSVSLYYETRVVSNNSPGDCVLIGVRLWEVVPFVTF